ncbi:MAG: hypothetical protein ACLUI6_08355 [Butyricicoccus sp.]
MNFRASISIPEASTALACQSGGQSGGTEDGSPATRFGRPRSRNAESRPTRAPRKAGGYDLRYRVPWYLDGEEKVADFGGTPHADAAVDT